MLCNIEIEDIKQIALKAGIEIMKIYKKDFNVQYKDDESPLTEADKIANEIICNELGRLYPYTPIMSEENNQTEYEIRKEWEYYWCIDPIDGTKEFIKKNDEFTINIALIHINIPILGVVYAPALNEVYYAKKNYGAYREVLNSDFNVLSKMRLPFVINNNIGKSLSIVASKSHLSQETQSFINNIALSKSNIVLISKGSSLKLCMVATGEADIYPRLGPTMEWDTAAADAIVRESGKMTCQFESKIPLVYNKKNLLNPWFIVHGDLEC